MKMEQLITFTLTSKRNMFEFIICIKTTNVEITIHNTSNRPANHKMSAYRAMINW